MARWEVSTRSVLGFRVLAGAGAGLAAAQLLSVALGRLLHVQPLMIPWTGWHLLTVLVFAAVGLVDDLWGDRVHRGLLGHVHALFRRGIVTTGTLKAVVGIVFGFLAGFALSEGSFWGGIQNGLLIALMAHLTNLLDVRPGRALKAYWILMLVTAATMADSVLGIPMLVASVIFAWYDFRGEATLGDAGAMVLGASLGFHWSIGIESAGWKWVPVLIVLFLSCFSEIRSFSAIIDGVPVLRYLDRLWVRCPGQTDSSPAL